MIISLAGCGRVSEEQYNKICAERDALQAELQELKDSAPPEEPDTVWVKLSGTFTATVRALVPDYVSDNTTPMMAVVTLFQSTPFTIYTGDLTEQLEPGETYVFELKAETLKMTAEEYAYMSNEAFLEEAAAKYGPRFSGFRKAAESDCGLDSVHLVFERIDEK